MELWDKKITLSNGVQMPVIGLGVYRIKDEDTAASSVKSALDEGYRMIDTAAAYGNESGVAKGILESGISRKDIFITTKLWNENIRQGTIRQALEESLEKLKTDYIDLYLIHWPVPELYLEAWKQLEEFYKGGLVRAIGVCNCEIHHLKAILEIAKTVPMVNQIEFHPYFTQEALLGYCKETDIQAEGWAPLANGDLLKDPMVQKLSQVYGRTPAQIILRWHLQKGVILIPKSVHRERIRENIQIFDFELSPEDMEKIDSLNTGSRLFWDPNNFSF